MKRWICALCALVFFLLIPVSLCPALAEQYVSIQELNAHPSDDLMWSKTYTSGKRDVDVSIPIIIPEADQMPVLEVEPWMPDLNERLNTGLIADDGWYGAWKKYVDVGLKDLSEADDDPSLPILCVSDKDSPLTEQSIFVRYHSPADLCIECLGKNGEGGCPKELLYPWEYGAPENVYAEDNVYSLEDALSYLDAVLGYYYDGHDGVSIDYVEVRGRLRKKDKQTGALGDIYDAYPAGTYKIHYFQNVGKIPMLLSSFSMYDYYTVMDSKVNTDRFNTFSEPPYYAEIMVPDQSLMLNNGFVKTVNTLENDIPLAPVEVIRKAIEEQIEKGTIRKVYSLRLGYVCFLNDASPSSFTLYPMWVLECDYASSPNEEIRVNPYSDGFRQGVGFTKLCFNAQSGEMIDRMKCTKESLECPDIVTWEDVQ